MTETIFKCPHCGRTVKDEEAEEYDYLCPRCGTDWWTHPLRKETEE